jgi:hypothetical protein
LFNRLRHQRVAGVLAALDADLLSECRCYFGGGTAIVLRHGEYRESADIDFLVSDTDGYRFLRQRVSEDRNLTWIFRDPPMMLRELHKNMYGIRTLLDADGEPVKFEIISEGHLCLDTPGADDILCGVATLTRVDMAATKLLANSDRWADRSTFSRDIIDLAMMQPSEQTFRSAVDKARNAYGDSVIGGLEDAVEYLRTNSGRLDECMKALRMSDTPREVLWERITALV